MSDDLHDQIYKNFGQKTNDELIAIWQTNDRVEWSALAFNVIREILQERNVEILPQADPKIQSGEKSESAKADIIEMNIFQILFSFKGRIGRGKYWLGALLIISFTSIVALIDVAFFDNEYYYGILTNIARILVIWPSLAVTIKRWHDRNKSGWWMLIGIIPFVGLFWAFIENGFLAGTEGANQYGSRSF